MQRNTGLRWRPAPAEAVAGKRIAVVGGTGGIGRALARRLAGLGAHVVVVGRTFRDADLPGIWFVEADLSLMREARRAAALLPAERLDALVFTTGIFAAPQRQETAEGIERDMAVSYLNRLAMLEALAPRLGRERAAGAARPRVFVTGYPGTGATGDPDDLNAEGAYRQMPVQLNTVAGNEALVLDAARRWPHAAFFGLNPGLVRTGIRADFFGRDSIKGRVIDRLLSLLATPPERYVERILPLLFSPDLDAHGGAMFDHKGRAILPSAGLDADRVARFIDASERLLARAGVRTAPPGASSSAQSCRA